MPKSTNLHLCTTEDLLAELEKRMHTTLDQLDAKVITFSISKSYLNCNLHWDGFDADNIGCCGSVYSEPKTLYARFQSAISQMLARRKFSYDVQRELVSRGLSVTQAADIATPAVLLECLDDDLSPSRAADFLQA